eukprot:4637510-Amphidinium_carterae.1
MGAVANLLGDLPILLVHPLQGIPAVGAICADARSICARIEKDIAAPMPLYETPHASGLVLHKPHNTGSACTNQLDVFEVLATAQNNLT